MPSRAAAASVVPEPQNDPRVVRVLENFSSGGCGFTTLGRLELLKGAPKPNPQISDAQWEEGRKYLIAEAHSGLGLIGLTRKKYDAAAAEFKVLYPSDDTEERWRRTGFGGSWRPCWSAPNS